jgi:hypothetical protein
MTPKVVIVMMNFANDNEHNHNDRRQGGDQGAG